MPAAHLEFGHLLGQMKQRLCALDVHRDRHLECLVKLDRGGRVKDDADLKQQHRGWGGVWSIIRLQLMSGPN